MVGREVGVKYCDMQGCCVGLRPGVRSYQSMVQAVHLETPPGVGGFLRSRSTCGVKSWFVDQQFLSTLEGDKNDLLRQCAYYRNAT